MDVLSELVDEDCLLHGWTSTQRVTLEEVRQALEGQRSAFPDWNITVGELIAEGDLVASTLTITGTHRGKFKSIEPTGKSVSFNGVFIERVRNGKIVEMWHRPDFLRLLMQIGAVSEEIMNS